MRNLLPNAETEVVLDRPIAIRAANRPFYATSGKRILDGVLAAMVILPLLAVMAILVPLIMLDGGSPIYFQNRVGRNGKTFRMWKLRSMVPDADRALDAYLAANPAARAEWDHSQKLAQDPRITFVGRFIRKTSLDELPQLLNVLQGDMSLVGPRPMMLSQRRLYPGTAYYALRPGITGFWQISARNQSSFAARAAFDAGYLNDVSLGTDLRVMLRTVGVVLRGTGC